MTKPSEPIVFVEVNKIGNEAIRHDTIKHDATALNPLWCMLSRIASQEDPCASHTQTDALVLVDKQSAR